jgi:hypothetical protein
MPRRKRKADQFKTFQVRRPRRVNTEKPTEQEELEALIERRTNAFIKFFDLLDEKGVSDDDRRVIARFATRDGYLSYAKNQDVEDLGDLQVEELTEVEYVSILKRAHRALTVILENRFNFVAGPFYTNRKMKRGAAARFMKKPHVGKGLTGAFKGRTASSKKIVERLSVRRQVRAALAAAR